MKESTSGDFKVAIGRINEILNEWDPIGVARSVRNEYEAYAPEIYQLLRGGVTAESLAVHLSRQVAEEMGLAARQDQELAVAKRLIELRLNESVAG